ncbi:MAG: 16S rRNA (cytidine(1402)-2'-O)-methyltransferase [Candidatus Omnitrophica bacterium]|nr:16S rRNA (cytidine(1402)-2'-O)-methyltransferase [Candidatus Omnitrophota bacterium]
MLYIVATPIGNLEDITLRALRVLREADYILVEDTRRAGLFMKHFNLQGKRLVSFYEHNEEEKIPRVIEYLKQAKVVALLSGSGMPLVSDPGFRLVKECIEQKLPFTCVPGASSLVNALVLSGCACDSFMFLGFLPKKKGKRLKKIEDVKNLGRTTIIFESPYRLTKTLLELKQALGDKYCCVCREMTKVYEEAIRGRLSEVIDKLSGKKIRGECTLVLQAGDKRPF